jgi:Xaa-Pro aminopeptidase
MIPVSIPASEIRRRLDAIQGKLQQTDIGGLLVLQRVDLLYFSGTAQNAILFIPVAGDPLLMVKKYFPRALQESSIKDTIEIQSITDIPKRITDCYGSIPPKIGMELDVLPVTQFHFYQKLFSGQLLVDGSGMILDTRKIKSEWEIGQMISCADLSLKTFEYMKSAIRPGLSEMEFAGMAEAFARKHGHMGRLRVRDFQTEVYTWHVLSGKNSAMLGLLDSPASGAGNSIAFPCGAGWKHMEAGEPIMIDFSTAMNGYHMDETRMFAIGSMPEKAMMLSRAAIDIHDAVLAKITPGMTADDVYEYSVSVAQKNGFSESYLGPSGYKVSFVGHGIGMEVIEPPILARGKQERLKPGMMFALEPKLVVKDEFMAGVESVFWVTETGTRLVSRVPVDVFIC